MIPVELALLGMAAEAVTCFIAGAVFAVLAVYLYLAREATKG